MMNPNRLNVFDPAGWRAFQSFTLREPAGVDRTRAVVDLEFTLDDAPDGLDSRQLRIVASDAGRLIEVVSQFYGLDRQGPRLTGRAVFFVDLPAGSSRDFRLYYGNPAASPPACQSGLRVTKGPMGPQHYLIENAFYKIETMPRSGQIWHVWNKLGSNTSWHHNEWLENNDKGGDPCHWAPNCWAGYPERITRGYEYGDGKEPDFFDWHYVFGWQDPATTVIRGPLFFEIRRSGVVWPHPEHSNPVIRRDGKARVRAEVVYRFYDGLPWFYQSSCQQTLQDMNVFFIRNGQFVFLDRVFTHAILAPERTADILPNDELPPAVIRLLAKDNLKPFPRMQHSLSNVLPSKLAYLGFFNSGNGDGFAQFHLAERNTNVHSGQPTYRNHATLFTELHDWSVYFCRAFSYTNRRFHPENATFLPKGERYEEENVCLIYKYEGLDAALPMLNRQCAEHNQLLTVEDRGGRFRIADCGFRI